MKLYLIYPQCYVRNAITSIGRHCIIHMYCRLIFFEDVLHLVELVLVLPTSAAQCEQAVSAQNRIKNSTIATLNVSVLEDLIRLS